MYKIKEIKVKVYEYKIIDKIYYVYVKENKEFTQFYLQENDTGIIEHQIGARLEDLQESIEDFINKNIIEWVYFYNKEYGG